MSTENTREACPHCEWFKQTFGGINDLSPREYWIATEIWTKLHGGRDYCYEGNGATTEIRVTREELASALREQVGIISPDDYRRIMDTAPCHYGICTVDNCGRCGRELNALTLLARFDAEKKRASERIEAEIRPLLDLRDAKLDEMDGKKT